ncbi:glycosyltransferase [Candidatus Peregrinibacteria bacterium]|nr:glycosyltransferase [Candidatus Peregrinibacteria bacterium]
MNDIIKKFKPFMKYCIVGAMGTFLDLAALYIFVEYISIPVIPASILSFLLAVTNNFLLNKSWTFRNKSKNYRKLYIKFFIVSLVGLGLTVTGMHVMVNIIGIWYMLAKVLTSLIVLTWNFLANKFWTFRLTEKNLFIVDDFPLELSVIIPAYNEENRIKNTLLAIEDYIKDNKINAEIIVVDDGSQDKTTQIVNNYRQKNNSIKSIKLEKNKGKGCAVKAGVEAGKGKYILFTDADNSTPIEEFEKLLTQLKSKNAKLAIGSRYLHDSNIKIKQPYYRILIGRIGNLLIRIFLIDDIKDTQCGFKLFEHRVAKEIFSFQKIKRFGFDMEALVIAQNLDYKIIEVPVSWFNSAESRFRPIKDSLRTLRDLVYIKLNLWSGRYNRDNE